MLESIHMQAAAMDGNYEVRQFNQPGIKVMEVPYQHLTPMIRQMCGRNRTRAAEGTRAETEELHEIDMEASEPSKMDNEDRIILDITRTGVAWTRTAAYWAGQVDEKRCQLCDAEDERSWRFWTCSKLKAAREEVDRDIADLDPKKLPMPVRHGIAPAMAAKGTTTFWGTDEVEENKYTERR